MSGNREFFGPRGQPHGYRGYQEQEFYGFRGGPNDRQLRIRERSSLRRDPRAPQVFDYGGYGYQERFHHREFDPIAWEAYKAGLHQEGGRFQEEQELYGENWRHEVEEGSGEENGEFDQREWNRSWRLAGTARTVRPPKLDGYMQRRAKDKNVLRSVNSAEEMLIAVQHKVCDFAPPLVDLYARVLTLEIRYIYYFCRGRAG